MNTARKKQTVIGSEPPQNSVRRQSKPPINRTLSFWRVWHSLLGLLCFAVMCWVLRRPAFHVGQIVPLLGGMGGLWVLLNLRTTRKEQDALWLIAPVAFTLLIWLPRPIALLAVAFAYLGHNRFGRASAVAQSWSCVQGKMLLLSLFTGRVVFDRLVHELTRFVPHTTTQMGSLVIQVGDVWLLFAGSLAGAATCLALYTLLDSISVQLATSSRKLVSGGFRATYRRLLGFSLMVLLTPLGMLMGGLCTVPLAILLLLSASAFQAGHRASQMHGNLRIAQAVGRIVTTQTDEDDVAAIGQRFLTLVQSIVPAHTARIWVLDAETGVLTPRAIWTEGKVNTNERVQMGEGIIGNATNQKHPRIIGDAARDMWKSRDENANGAWLLYPIRAKGQLVAIGQWVRPVGHPFTQEDIVRLDTLAPSIAMSLENLHIRETMHLLASTDGLTGLWNHRRMQDVMRDEVRRSARYHHAISILMLDVDSFKSFNDTYGHPQGDQMLRSVSDALTATVRNTDFVGRYGGEEFIIILPETAKHDACKLAERVRKAVETNAFVLVNDLPVHRTVSVGVATYPEDALNAQELVQRADDALYEAKRTGKNRVIWS